MARDVARLMIRMREAGYKMVRWLDELSSGGGGPTRDGVACMCLAGLAGDGRAEFYSLWKRLVLDEESGVQDVRETGKMSCCRGCLSGDGVFKVATWSGPCLSTRTCQRCVQLLVGYTRQTKQLAEAC